jgi:hypothetical protein
MSLRAQTAELTTYVMNDRALKAVRESEQFTFLMGTEGHGIECLTAEMFGLLEFKLPEYVIARYPQGPVVVHSAQTWEQFQKLVKEWNVECGTTSSPIEMATCPAYQKILAMGKPAVRFILRQLESEGDDPDHWFWALNKLTGEDPVAPEDRGNLRKMSAAWLQWGRNNRHVW